jgi:hypothetical protein
VAARDYTGSDTTAESLGLPSSIAVGLLSYSSISASVSSVQSPRLGYVFNPATDLKLDGTSAQGIFDSSFNSAWTAYAHTSTFLAVAYIISVICVILSPILSLFVRRHAFLGKASITLSTLSTLFLLAASIASVIIFTRLNNAFNSAFSDAGLSSTLGNGLFILSFLSFFFSLLATTLIWRRTHNASTAARDAFPVDSKAGAYEAYTLGQYPKSQTKHNGFNTAYAQRGLSPSPDRSGVGNGPLAFDDKAGKTAKKGGLLSRVPGLQGGRHRYVQIEEQNGRAASRTALVEGGNGERTAPPSAYEPYTGHGL